MTAAKARAYRDVSVFGLLGLVVRVLREQVGVLGLLNPHFGRHVLQVHFNLFV